jgi:hypothetical protein
MNTCKNAEEIREWMEMVKKENAQFLKRRKLINQIASLFAAFVVGFIVRSIFY